MRALKRTRTFQHLEQRQLLAVDFSSFPLVPIARQLPLGDQAVFAFESRDAGNEVFAVGSGGAVSPELLHDLVPGTESSFPSDFTQVGDRVAFLTCIGEHSVQLWITDGTPEGLQKLGEYGSADRPHPIDSIVGATDSAIILRESLREEGGVVQRTLLQPIDGSAASSFLIGERFGYAGLFIGKELVVHVEASATSTKNWVTDGTARGTSLLSSLLPELPENLEISSESLPVGSGVAILAKAADVDDFVILVQRVNGELTARILAQSLSSASWFSLQAVGQDVIVSDRYERYSPFVIDDSGVVTELLRGSEWDRHGLSRSLNGEVIGFQDDFLLLRRAGSAGNTILQRDPESQTLTLRDDLPLVASTKIQSVGDWLVYHSRDDISEPETRFAVHPASGTFLPMNSEPGFETLRVLGVRNGAVYGTYSFADRQRFRIFRFVPNQQTTEVILDVPYGEESSEQGSLISIIQVGEEVRGWVRHLMHTDLVTLDLTDGSMELLSRFPRPLVTRDYPMLVSSLHVLETAREGIYYYQDRTGGQTGVFTNNGEHISLPGFREIDASEEAIYAVNRTTNSIVRINLDDMSIDRFRLPFSGFAVGARGAIFVSEGRGMRLDDGSAAPIMIIDRGDWTSLSRLPVSSSFDRPRVLVYEREVQERFVYDGTIEGSYVLAPAQDRVRLAWLRGSQFAFQESVNAESGIRLRSLLVERPGESEMQLFNESEQSPSQPYRIPGGWSLRVPEGTVIWMDHLPEPSLVNGHHFFTRPLGNWSIFRVSGRVGGADVRDLHVIEKGGKLQSLLELLSTDRKSNQEIDVLLELEGGLVFLHREGGFYSGRVTAYHWDGNSDSPTILSRLTEYYRERPPSSRVFAIENNWVVSRWPQSVLVPMDELRIRPLSEVKLIELLPSETRLVSSSGVVNTFVTEGKAIEIIAERNADEIDLVIEDPETLPLAGLRLELTEGTRVRLSSDQRVSRVDLKFGDSRARLQIAGRPIELIGQRIELDLSIVSEQFNVEVETQVSTLVLNQEEGRFGLELQSEKNQPRFLWVNNETMLLTLHENVRRVHLDQFSNAFGTLSIARTSATTQLQFPPDFVRQESRLVNAKHIGVGQTGQLVIRSDFSLQPLHNFSNPFDVNSDSRTSALDALAVINQVASDSAEPTVLADVNADGRVSPADALQIINRLGRTLFAEGESAGVVRLSPSPANLPSDSPHSIDESTETGAASPLFGVNQSNRVARGSVFAGGSDSSDDEELLALRIANTDSAFNDEILLESFWVRLGVENLL